MSHLVVVTPTPAADLPVKVDALVNHLRLGAVDATQSAHLSALLSAARDYVEAMTGRSMALATYRESFTAPGLREKLPTLQLLRGPVVSVSGLTYRPADGSAAVTLAATPAGEMLPALTGLLPGALLITDSALALELADRPDALVVDYVAGYAAGHCPEGLRQAVLLLAALWFEERLPVNIGNIVNELPFGLAHLIQHQRVSGWCA